MDFNAVYHQASDNYCYPLNEEELIINIKRRRALGWSGRSNHL